MKLTPTARRQLPLWIGGIVAVSMLGATMTMFLPVVLWILVGFGGFAVGNGAAKLAVASVPRTHQARGRK